MIAKGQINNSNKIDIHILTNEYWKWKSHVNSWKFNFKLLEINFNQECNFELFVDGIYSLGWARKQSGYHWNIYFSTLRTVLTILTLGKCFVFNVDIDGVAFYWFEIVKIYSHPFGIAFCFSQCQMSTMINILTVWYHQLGNYDWYTQLKAI